MKIRGVKWIKGYFSDEKPYAQKERKIAFCMLVSR